MHRALPILSVLLLAACASAPPKPAAPPPPTPAPATVGTAQLAIANLASASGTLVSGRVELRPAAGGVRVTGIVGGLTRNGAHGLQVHERGDCSAVDARSAGAYFDPTGARGVGGSSDRIVADPDGVARVDLLLRGAVLGGGAPNDIAARALVVLGATSGASSARVACGVIKVQP
jgi:Cu-Zn family superoxide dismutase